MPVDACVMPSMSMIPGSLATFHKEHGSDPGWEFLLIISTLWYAHPSASTDYQHGSRGVRPFLVRFLFLRKGPATL